MLREAVKKHAGESGVIAALVGFYLSYGRIEEGESFLRAIVAKDASNREARGLLATLLLEGEQPAEGIKQLERAVAIHPGDRVFLENLFNAYLAERRYDQAEKLIARMSTYHRSQAQGHLLRARLLHARGEPRQALEELNEAITLDDNMLHARFEKAGVLLQLQRTEEAEATLRDLLLREPTHTPARVTLSKLLSAIGRDDEALLEAKRAIELEPENWEAQVVHGDALIKNGTLSLARAKEIFADLAETHAEAALPRFRLGTIDLLSGDQPGAARWFREAVPLASSPEDAISDLVSSYTRRKDYDGALRALDEISELTSKKDFLEIQKGRIFAGRGDLQAAEAAFLRAVELNSDNHEAYLMLARASSERGGLNEAIDTIDMLIEHDPGLDVAHVTKGIYLYRQGNPAGAAASYEKALAARPDNAAASNNLAWIYLETDRDIGRALELASNARRLAPENPEYADTLGWIHYRMGNHGAAVEQLQFSVNERKQRAQPVHYYRLGMAYYGGGNMIQAEEQLTTALRFGIDFEESADARRILNELGRNEQHVVAGNEFAAQPAGTLSTPPAVTKAHVQSPTTQHKQSTASSKPLYKLPNWLMTQPGSTFTLQLGVFSSAMRAETYLASQEQPERIAIYQLSRGDKLLHVVVYGSFATRVQAESEALRLRASLGSVEPWVRPLSQIQEAIRTTQQ